MRLEFIDNVTEDDMLGKNIFTYDGRILLKAGTKLSHKYISRLKYLGILYVYIEDHRLSDVLKKDEYLDELKQNSIKSIHSIGSSIRSNNIKDMKDSLNAVKELIDYVIEIKDVYKSLYDIKTYDNYTNVHSLNTCIRAMFLGASSNLSEDDIRELGIASILHDVGKTEISINITNKKGRLTVEEFEEMKKHPIHGARILEKLMCFSNKVIKGVLEHHEKIDGTGYPYGFSGDDISMMGKIISICDVYDAVVSDRIYRKRFTLSASYDLIINGSGSQFDESLVNNFRNTFAVYPLGCCVKLSSGEEGYVIKQNSDSHDKPTIRVLYDSATKKPVQFYEIDIMKNPDIKILDVV